MKDLCNTCKNFKDCGFGGGKKLHLSKMLRPSIKQVKVNNSLGHWIVVKCNLFDDNS